MNHRSKFVVLTSQRSGSTWLMSTLNNIPNVRIQGELFLPRNRTGAPRWDTEFAIPRFVECRQKHRRRPFALFSYLNEFYDEENAVGFKLMYSQVRKYPEIFAYVARHRIQVVHLVRRNHLDVLISGLIKKQLGKAHILEGQSKPDDEMRISIDISVLLRRLHQLDKKQRFFRAALKWTRLPHIEVAYEDLLSGQNYFEPIWSFLRFDIPQEFPKSNILKMRKKGHADTIVNYDAVRAKLTGTCFESMLENPRTTSDTTKPSVGGREIGRVGVS